MRESNTLADRRRFQALNNGVDDLRDVSTPHRNTMNDPHEKPPPAGPAIDVDALKRAIAAVVATVIVAVCETLWRRR